MYIVQCSYARLWIGVHVHNLLLRTFTYMYLYTLDRMRSCSVATCVAS